MTPKALLFAHRYEEAVEAFRLEMLKHPELNLYPEVGRAYLGLQRFEEAREAFATANQLSERSLPGSLPCLNEEAAASWLTGMREHGLKAWRRAVDGVLDGRIRFGDASGGVTQGLLLWYGAVSLKNEGQQKFAREFLRVMLEKDPDPLWPGALAALVGGAAAADVLEQAAKVRDLPAAIDRAARDLLVRRRLCGYLFYVACLHRESGDEVACAAAMQSCRRLENPIIEVEWYLARSEAGEAS